VSHPQKLPPFVPRLCCVVSPIFSISRAQRIDDKPTTQSDIGLIKRIIEARERNQTGESPLGVSSNHQIKRFASCSSPGIYKRLRGLLSYCIFVTVIWRGGVVIVNDSSSSLIGGHVTKANSWVHTVSEWSRIPTAHDSPPPTSATSSAYKMSCLSGYTRTAPLPRLRRW
jgi:hypothetical protein